MADGLFFTDAYGATNGPDEKLTQYTYNSADVLISTQSSTDRLKGHSRSGFSSNPVRPIKGTSTPWRAPSSYKRSAWQYSLGGPSTWKFGSTTLKDSQVFVTQVDGAYSATGKRCPFFVGLGNSVSTDAEHANAWNKCTTKALVDLASSKAGLGENLAEAIKTSEMLLDHAIAVAKLARLLKRGKIYNAISHLNLRTVKKAIKSGKLPKAAANSWLAYWYGYRPLALDTYGLYELFLERLKPALLCHGRGSAHIDYAREGLIGTGGGRSPTFSFSETVDFGYRCGLTGMINSAEYLRTLNRVGLLNPVSIAWELVPFSFVVDWVLPLGDVAYAMSAPAGLDFVGGHRVRKWNRQVIGEVIPPSWLPGSPTCIFTGKGTERQRLTAFPRPLPYIKPPFGGPSRIATVLSLITQLKK